MSCTINLIYLWHHIVLFFFLQNVVCSIKSFSEISKHSSSVLSKIWRWLNIFNNWHYSIICRYVRSKAKLKVVETFFAAVKTDKSVGTSVFQLFSCVWKQCNWPIIDANSLDSIFNTSTTCVVLSIPDYTVFERFVYEDR